VMLQHADPVRRASAGLARTLSLAEFVVAT
jgi:hypothetical protein